MAQVVKEVARVPIWAKLTPSTTDIVEDLLILNALTREGETAKWRDPTGTVAVSELDLHEDGILRCARVGYARFERDGRAAALALYWFEGYGGGLWLPFLDATSGSATYGGGRYLYDVHKSDFDEVADSEHHFMVGEIAGDAFLFEAIRPNGTLIDCGADFRTPAASAKHDTAIDGWLSSCHQAVAHTMH